MITLTKAHVTKYKAIDNSTPVAIDDQVTVLVGKNESGKTCFLEALHKSLHLDGEYASFDVVSDYPRKEYVRYQSRHKGGDFDNIVELSYRVEPELATKINAEVFGGAHVVKGGQEFTRTVNYDNSTTVGLHLDKAAALVALKKPLAALEHADEVFKDATVLKDVLVKIEAKALPADSQLANFAKTWRDRTKDMGKNWDVVEYYAWHTYIKPATPLFLYFDDYRLLEGKINLPALQQRQSQNRLTESDETVMGLFDLADIKLEELMSESGYEHSKAKLEAIGLSITDQVFEYWKQNTDLTVEFDVKNDPADEQPYNNGKNLYIRIKNGRHGVTLPFGQRSKGFIWFFSFMAWFSAIAKRVGAKSPLVLLLDEPGLNLHALAQKDFLDYIDRLAEEHQIIYTTHSPFMVKSDHLAQVRVVEDKPKAGTKITANLGGAADDSLFPLQAALGYSIAQNLFIGKDNVLLEGPADLILLQHMGSLIEAEGSKGIGDNVLVPVGGLDKVATFVALLGANDLNIVVLHDRATAPDQRLEDLVQHKLIERKSVLDYSMFKTPGEPTDVEDLFPVDLYLHAFNAAYAKELKGVTATEVELPPRPRIVERLNAWLQCKGIVLLKAGGYNHYRVAQALLPLLTSKTDSTVVGRFKTIFAKIDEIMK